MPRQKIRITRKESQELTRQRLLEAARRQFARDGHSGTSVDRIAAEAGFSKGAFYSNFDSKEAILLEILAGHHADYIEDLRTAIDNASSAEELHAALCRWSEMRNHEPEWADLNIELLFQAKRDPRFRARYLAYFQRYRAALTELIELRFAKVGRLPPAPVEALASALIALADGFAMQRGLAGSPELEITGTMLNLVSDGWLAIAQPFPSREDAASGSSADRGVPRAG